MRLVVVCLLLAGLPGCTSPTRAPDESSPTRPTPAYDEDAVRDGLADLFAGGNPTPREARTAECFADELTARASPEKLRDGGLVADDGGVVRRLPPLPEELAGLTADAQLACVDVVEASTRALTSVRKGDLDPEAYAACLVEAVPREAQRDALVATLAGRYDDPALARLSDAQVSCAAEQD